MACRVMRIFAVVAILAASFGCEWEWDHYEEKCVDGKTYYRNHSYEVFKLLDGTPSHAAITPVPCVNDERSQSSHGQ